MSEEISMRQKILNHMLSLQSYSEWYDAMSKADGDQLDIIKDVCSHLEANAKTADEVRHAMKCMQLCEAEFDRRTVAVRHHCIQ